MVGELQALVWLRQLLARQDGQSMVEYGLMVSLIAIAAIAAVLALGGTIEQYFQAICAAVAQGQCS